MKKSIILLAIFLFSKLSFAATIICGVFEKFDNKGQIHKARIYRIWNLFMESETKEEFVSMPISKNGFFKLKLSNVTDMIINFEGNGTRVKFFVKRDDSLFIRISSSGEIQFSGNSVSSSLNNLLFKENILEKDVNLGQNDLSDSSNVYKSIDSIQILMSSFSIPQKNNLFENYHYAQLLGKQFMRIDYFEKTFKLDTFVRGIIDSIWNKFPVLGNGAKDSRAYLNSSLFYSYRVCYKNFFSENDPRFNLYEFNVKRLSKDTNIFHENTELLGIHISSALRSLIYVSTNPYELELAEAKLLSYSKYSQVNHLVKESIKRAIAIKKIELGVKYISNIKLSNDKNQKTNIRDIKAEYIVIDFWATWCVPCVQEIIWQKENREKYKIDIKYVYININDNKERWLAFLRRNKLSNIQLFASKSESEKIKIAYGFYEIPHKILADKFYRIISSNKDKIKEFLLPLLSDKAK